MKSVIVVVLLLGCSTADGPAPGPKLTRADAVLGCALGVPGATATAEDTPEGIALSFTAKDRTVEMRERARDAAAQHGPGQGQGRGHDGRHGDGAEHGLKMMQAPPARSVATDIEGGARIGFVAIREVDAAELRAKLRERVVSMNASCR